MSPTNESRPESTRATGSRTASPSRRGRFPSPTVSATVARVELRRMFRRIRAQDVWLALVVLGSLAVLAVLPVAFDAASAWGTTLASGDAAPASTVSLLVASGWVFVLAMGVVAGVGSYGEIDEPAGMLTVRPPKDVAGGLLLMNAVGYVPYVVVPFGVGFAGLAAGAGTPLVLVGGATATAALLASAMAIGYPVGLALKGAVRRSKWLSRLKPAIGTVVAVAYFWVMFAGHLPALVDALSPVLDGPPLTWLGDLALVTTPGADASAVGAAAALGLTVAVVPVGVLATVRGAEFAWFTDEQRDGGDEAEPDGASGSGSGTVTPTGSTRLGDAFGLVCRRRGTAGVAATTLVRAYRAPLQLLFAAVPLVFALPMVEGALATGTVPSYAPWFAMLYGAWAAGVAAPLNLLGNQGATLPGLLTSRASGREVVHGHVLAVVAPVAPVAAVLSGAAAHATGRSPPEAVGFAGLALVVVAGGAVVAAALGARFPRFDGIDVTADRTATPPSKAAFALYSILAALGVSAAGVLTDELYRVVIHSLLAPRLPFGLSLSVAGLERVALGVAVVLAAAVPAAYVLAVRRVSDYHIE
ncbi:hypothetical protein I7X12_05060 [Halosimplex litoreum]|uniref:ABC-2 type transport system permease protein n=1 Tax=Halosimplex litoreum TaxID=1198301 RepID=A0A7T3G0G7_9EURY|nr:hypothetical protein [Halosimplex litoreum]QPV64001.1 hypothetical protein I7X12_05060 [Halosimplex litoreum]